MGGPLKSGARLFSRSLSDFVIALVTVKHHGNSFQESEQFHKDRPTEEEAGSLPLRNPGPNAWAAPQPWLPVTTIP